MANKFGVKIYGPGPDPVNQTLGVPWEELVGSITITVGPFDTLTQGSPHQCTVTVHTNALGLIDEDITNEIGIAFYGPCGADTPVQYVEQLSNDDFERIVFFGELGDFQSRLPSYDGILECSFVGTDSQFLTAKSHLSSGTNHGVQTVLSQIASDVGGIYPDSWEQFPDAVVGYTMDRPAQGTDTNGSYLATHTAPYGMWTTCEWVVSYTGDVWDSDPQTAFRPSWFADWYDTAPTFDTSEPAIEIDRPWLIGVPDYGRQWGDFPNRFDVSGVGGASGTFNHASATLLGNRRVDISSYIDTSGECGNAAEHLGTLCAMPHIKMFDVVIPIEPFYRALVRAGSSTDDAEAMCWKLGAARVGDQVQFDTTTHTWPADSWTTEDQMTEIVKPYITKDGGSPSPFRQEAHEITRVKRTWNQTTGWTVNLSLKPHTGGTWA